jgi:hypothetical protein
VLETQPGRISTGSSSGFERRRQVTSLDEQSLGGKRSLSSFDRKLKCSLDARDDGRRVGLNALPVGRRTAVVGAGTLSPSPAHAAKARERAAWPLNLASLGPASPVSLGCVG